MVEDVCRGDVVTAPGGLVGEVAQEAGAHIVVSGCVGVVQTGDPVLAGVGVAAQVEAVPGDGLGQGGRQGVQALPEGGCVAAVFEQFGHRGQVGVQQRGGGLPLLGGVTGELLGGVLQERDEVLADRFAVAGLGERDRRAGGPVRGQRGQGGAGDREEGAAVHRCSQGLSQSGHGTVGSERDHAVGGERQPVRPVVSADDVRRPAERFGDVDLRFLVGLDATLPFTYPCLVRA
ncbi:hypothetical protein [Streptomyces adustus]|uniref:hypothetical protein n=1 Tax=Streptomyces adustus TaxID=1609272 RepID=UPI001EE3F682|nr:hypothetical protein [Streptomyces adustus]